MATTNISSCLYPTNLQVSAKLWLQWNVATLYFKSNNSNNTIRLVNTFFYKKDKIFHTDSGKYFEILINKLTAKSAALLFCFIVVYQESYQLIRQYHFSWIPQTAWFYLLRQFNEYVFVNWPIMQSWIYFTFKIQIIWVINLKLNSHIL